MTDSTSQSESQNEAGERNERTHPPLRPHSRPPVGAEERLSTVIGDRVCINCGFNLFGQPIFRESVYDMLIIRCPECGAVASVHEYPLLGKWTKRWGYLLAGFWVLMILGLVATGSLSIGGAGYAIADQMVEPYAVEIGRHYVEWGRANPDKALGTGNTWWQNETDIDDFQFTYIDVDEEWWSTIGRSEVRQAVPGWRDRLDLRVIDEFIWLAFWLVILGIFWSVVAPSGGKRRAVVVTLIMLVFAIGWAYMLYSWTRSYWGWGGIAASAIALRDAGTLITGCLTLAFGLCVLVGAMFGRAIVRWLVIALLPPRMRGWLAYLWIVDGKAPPRMTWVDR